MGREGGRKPGERLTQKLSKGPRGGMAKWKKDQDQNVTIGLGNRAIIWDLHKGHTSGTEKAEAAASTVGRESHSRNLGITNGK